MADPREALRKPQPPDKQPDLVAALMATEQDADVRPGPSARLRSKERQAHLPSLEDAMKNLEVYRPDVEQRATLRRAAATGFLTDQHWGPLKAMLGPLIAAEKKDIRASRMRLERELAYLYADLVVPGEVGDVLPAVLTEKERSLLQDIIVKARSVADDGYLWPQTGRGWPQRAFLRNGSSQLAGFLRDLYCNLLVVQETDQEGRTEESFEVGESLWGREMLEPAEMRDLATASQPLTTPDTILRILDAELLGPEITDYMKANLSPGIMEAYRNEELTGPQRREVTKLIPLLPENLALYEAIETLRESFVMGKPYQPSELHLSALAMRELISRHQARLQDQGDGKDRQLAATKRIEGDLQDFLALIERTLRPSDDFFTEEKTGVGQEGALQEGDNGPSNDQEIAIMEMNGYQLNRLSEPKITLDDDDRLTRKARLASLAHPHALERMRVEYEPYRFGWYLDVAPYLKENPARCHPSVLSARALNRLQYGTTAALLAAGEPIPWDKVPEAMRRTLVIMGAHFDPSKHASFTQKIQGNERFSFTGEGQSGGNKGVTVDEILELASQVAERQGALRPYKKLQTPDKPAAALACGFAAQTLAVAKSVAEDNPRELEHQYASLIPRNAPSLSEMALLANTAYSDRKTSVWWLGDLGSENFNFAHRLIEERRLPEYSSLVKKYKDRFPDEKALKASILYLISVARNTHWNCGLSPLDEEHERSLAPVALMAGGSGVGKDTILGEILADMTEILLGERIDDGVVNHGSATDTPAGYESTDFKDGYQAVYDRGRNIIERRQDYPGTPEQVKNLVEGGWLVLLRTEWCKAAVNKPGERKSGGFARPGSKLQEEALQYLSKGGWTTVKHYDPLTGQTIEVRIETPYIPTVFADTWQVAEEANEEEKEEKKEKNEGERREKGQGLFGETLGQAGEESKKGEGKKRAGWVTLPADPVKLAETIRHDHQFVGRVAENGIIINFDRLTQDHVLTVLRTPWEKDDPGYNHLNPVSIFLAKAHRAQRLYRDNREIRIAPEVLSVIATHAEKNLDSIGWRGVLDVTTAMANFYVQTSGAWVSGDPRGRGGLNLDAEGNLVITPQFVDMAMAAQRSR